MGIQLLNPCHTCSILRCAVCLHVLLVEHTVACLVLRAVPHVMQGYFFSIWNICAVFQVRSVQKQCMFHALAAVLVNAVLTADCITGLLPAASSSVFQ